MNPRSSPAVKIAKSICVLIPLTLGILLIPNLYIFDEELSPEINMLLKDVGTPNLTDNGAVYIYGINAESTKDSQEVGERVLTKLREKYKRNEAVNLSAHESIEISGVEGDSDKHWQNLYPSVINCNPKNEISCFESLLTEINITPITNERLLAQIERYRILINQQHFVEDVEIMDATSPLPPYGLTLQIGRLLDANTYQKMGFSALLEIIAKDTQFWRMALKETQTLVGKMVAIGALRANLHSLSFGLRNEKELTDNQRVMIKHILSPLDAAETTMGKALLSELRLATKERRQFLKYFTEAPVSNAWLLSKMVQPTASVNLFYQQTFEPTYRLSNLAIQDFYLKTQQPLTPRRFSPINPYNLAGKIRLSEIRPLTGYIGRIHDLAGLHSMIAIQLELQAINPENHLDAINRSEFRNPYTQKPFDFDIKMKEISFRCFDARDSCRIKF